MLQIKKRNNEFASFNPNKIYNRIKRTSRQLKINVDEICIKVITSIPTEGVISTKEIDKLIAEISASYTGNHYDYSKLASSVSISSYHKSTNSNFYEVMYSLYNEGIINKILIDKINNYGIEEVNDIINYDNDYIFDYFGWKALENTYLLKNSNGILVERPQQMYLRVALWVTNNLEDAKDYYNSLSKQLISCATPIMINSGTKNAQLSSCVLKFNEGDSRNELLGTFTDICSYSSDAAGIGLCLSNIRSKDSKISSSGGNAGGLLKYLKIVNEGLRFFNQQGKRPGAAAIYIEPWHKDIFDLLEIKKNTGAEELRARDIFTALWVPDNFMKALKEDKEYYLFCPNEIVKSGLKPFYEIYGEEFEEEYEKAVKLGIGKKIMAKDLAIKIVESQIETGSPYITYKDNANRKTNHQNIGTIKQSNLCAEIFQYSDKSTTAICTLSSIVIKNFIKDKKFDFNLLRIEVKKVVKALNKVIDINHYTTEKGEKGGLEQRAIAIGVQGLADVYFILDLVFNSPEAKELNKIIFETIYFSSIEASMELCKLGLYKPYKYFEGSPMSKGIFQFDMCTDVKLSGLWNWDSLKEDVIKYGICNSLFTAQMPVAGSAKITTSYEMTEPAQSSLFNRSVLGGEITIMNQYLISDLEKIGLWNEDMKNELIMNDGSIQNLNFLKFLDIESKNYDKKVSRIEYLIEKYKTIWEISQKELISMAVDRSPFIDQSQSMNIYMANPTVSKVLSSLIFSWESGLKTGSYYLRTRAISTGAKHLGISLKNVNTKIPEKVPEKPSDSPFDCFGCSS